MAGGRRPGPAGQWQGHSLATSGPLGSGPSAAQVRPVVAPPQPSPRPDAEIAAGEDDLQLLQRVFGPAFLDSAGRVRYIEHGKAGWQYKVDEYLRDRDGFFGAGGAYAETRDTGISELDADDEKLRRLIEPNLKVRNHKPEWREAQNIFYAWVRRAFEKQLGDGTDIPGLIKAGMSETLRAALQQVKLDYGHAFQYGGFNPRPMKKSGAYRLGTLSDHALGRAIDIDAAQNAQIDAAKWNAIMAYAGVTAVELGALARKSKWKSRPQELHGAIANMNGVFVKKLAAAVATKVSAGQNDGQALEAVVGEDASLKTLGVNWVRQWRGGFFALPWALVKELYAEKFLWGATFSTADLHHFELPKEGNAR